MSLLYFSTGDCEVDTLLNSLSSSADDCQIVDNYQELQNWLIGVISRIEKLPIPYSDEINIRVFQIGDRHWQKPPTEVHMISSSLVKQLSLMLENINNPPNRG